jgi:prepilin-type N-terminal cleavage/methylation domain-containing protein
MSGQLLPIGARDRWHRESARAISTGGQGFTLTEILVASVLMLIVLSALYSALESNRRTYAVGQRKVEVQQNARIAMETILTDIRLAGYGYPTDPALVAPLLKITAATATSITFWADLNNRSTLLSADVNAGATNLPVASASGVSAGETIWLINGGKFESATVSAVAGNTITVSAGISAAYPQATQVGRPRQITFSWAGTTLSRDDSEGGGAQSLAAGIQTFQLRYFNDNNVLIPTGSLAASLASIRRIQISITAQSSSPAVAQIFTLTSDVRPRNLF